MNIINNDFNVILLLCKNCKSENIIEYFDNYVNKLELQILLLKEDLYCNNPFSYLLKNFFFDEKLLNYLIGNFKHLFNSKNKYNIYPINYAIEYFHQYNYRLIRNILDNTNLDIVKDCYNNNILHQLVLVNKKYSLNYIKYLHYKYNYKHKNQKNTDGSTPILLACERNYTNVIEFLLFINCDISINNNNNNTCLMKLCSYNNFNLIKKFLKKHNNINLKDCQGDTALSYLCGCDSNYSSDIEIIKYFIEEKNAEYNIINDENNSLLIYATGVFSKNINYVIDINILKYLINLGIDLNITNKYNKTCLDYLAIKNINILQELINDNSIYISNDLKLKYYYLKNITIDKTQISFKYNNYNNMCIICFDEFTENEELLICHNKHTYHTKCLSQWFNSNNLNTECPTCKDTFIFSKEIFLYKN